MTAWGTLWWVGAAVALVTPVASGPGVAAGTRPTGSTTARALAVLHDWDASRAGAWSAGDTAALRALYTRGSAAGRADVRLLERYRGRGLHVHGLATQVLCLAVLGVGAGRLRVRVVDRLAGGTACGHGQCVPLPRDRATQRTVTLRRVDDHWLVTDVR